MKYSYSGVFWGNMGKGWCDVDPDELVFTCGVVIRLRQFW